MSATIVPLNAAAFAATLPELLSIYASAMDYSPTVAHARAPLWLDHSRRIGFRCVIAVDGEEPTTTYDDFVEHQSRQSPGQIAGFSYGYRGAIGQWWFNEVARGLGNVADPWLLDYFELTELHVRPSQQGRGIGEALLRALVAPAPNRAVLLSTPEGENRAWRLYRRLHFENVLRTFLFSGDGRPFAVLGRSLPLDAAPSDAPPILGHPAAS